MSRGFSPRRVPFPTAAKYLRMIRVNDKHEIAWHDGITVSNVLEAMDYTYHNIIVKVNGELVRKTSYDVHKVPDGSDVKAIHLIGGG